MSAHRIMLHGLVLIFSATAAAQGSGKPLTLVREAMIDASTSDLSPIGWLTVSSDGTIAISQPQDYNIRFFSRTGTPIGMFGRKGQGPGEFGAMTLHGWLADTLWIGDFTTYRITLIAPGGSLVRSNMWPQKVRSVDPSHPLPAYIGTPIHAYYRDGSVIVIGIPSSAPVPAWMNRPSGMFQPFLRVSKDGAFQRVVMWMHDWDDKCRIGTSKGVYPRPLCFQPFWAVSQHGGAFVTAQVERSDQAHDFVRALAVNANGDTLFSRLLPVRRDRVAAQVADSIRRAFENMLGKATRAPVDPVEIPDVYPPFVQALVAVDEKTVWFERGVAIGEREWMLVDMSGQSVASLRVPRSLELKAVSIDRVWAIEKDNDGLERIVVLRVQR
jgi:hypothetical protein